MQARNRVVVSLAIATMSLTMAASSLRAQPAPSAPIASAAPAPMASATPTPSVAPIASAAPAPLPSVAPLPIATAPGHAAAPAASASAGEVAAKPDVAGAPVRIHDRRVFVVLAPRGGRTAEQRASAAGQVLERVLDETEEPE